MGAAGALRQVAREGPPRARGLSHLCRHARRIDDQALSLPAAVIDLGERSSPHRAAGALNLEPWTQVPLQKPCPPRRQINTNDFCISPVTSATPSWRMNMLISVRTAIFPAREMPGSI